MRKRIILFIMTALIAALSCWVVYNRDTLSTLSLTNPLAGVFSDSSQTDGNNNIVHKIAGAAGKFAGNLSVDFKSFGNYFINRDFLFNKVSFATADNQNNIYFIDNSLQRIGKMNPNHNIELLFKANDAKNVLNADGQKYKNNIFSASEITVDNNGHFYVMYKIMEPYGLNVISEVILQYSQDGGKKKLVFQQDYTKGTGITAGRLMSLQYNDGFLYVFDLDDSSGTNHIKLFKIREDDFKNVKTEAEINLPAGMNLLDISGTSWGSIVFSTMNGEIYKVSGPDNREIVFSESRENDLQLPWHLWSFSNENVYYADVIKKEIYKFSLKDGADNKSIDFSGKDFKDIRIIKYNNVFVSGSGMTVAATLIGRDDDAHCNSGIAFVKPDGQKLLIYKASYSPLELVNRWLVFAAVLVILVLLIAMLRMIYVYWMKKRIPLFLKQLFVFVPLLLITLAVISGIVYSGFSAKYEKEIDQKLMLIAHIGSVVIDGDVLSRISKPEDFMDQDYQTVRSQIHSLFEEKQDRLSETDLYDKISGGMYIALYKVDKDNNIYTVMYYDDTTFYTPMEATGEEMKQYLSVYEKGVIEENSSRDSDGYWKYAIGPVYNSNGTIVGICEAGMNMSGFDESMSNLRIQLIEAVSTITVLFILAFFIMTYYLLKSLRVLRDSVSEIASGNFDTQVTIKSNDEVADLSESFNSMSSHIRGYVMKLTTLSEAYYRFVPQQFLSFLGKESILDVRLGDHEEMTMSVLFCNIRSFSALSQTMTPEENFNFINSFLNQMGPTVRENSGFIDKYLGAGIMALFANEAENAVKSAIGMRKCLREYNTGRENAGYNSIEIGIGIHTGTLMLGVIGEEKRLEGTVISDNVNLSAVIEALTEKFGASVLITEDTYKLIPKAKRYKNRSLGLIRIEGKSDPMKIFDIFEEDKDTDRKLKQKTKEAFEEGIQFYQCGRFYDARCRFIEVIKENRADKAAKIYFLLCDEYSRTGSPEGWDGTINSENL